MSKFKDIKTLLKHLIGDENTLSNNVLFIDFTGSHEKGQYLSQLFYWSNRTKIKDGWIAKRHEDWYEEIRVKAHSIRRFSKEFNDKGFLEMKLKKFNKVTMPHYRLDQDILIEHLLTFCKGYKLEGLQIVNLGITNCQPSQGNKLSTSTNRDYTETTTENKGAKKIAPEKNVKPQPKDVFQNVTGLKAKIGPKQYDALNALAEDKETYDRLRRLYPDGKFEMLTNWMEYRKESRKHMTKRAVKMVLSTFENFTALEMEDAIKASIENGYQGLFPKKSRPDQKQKSETENNLNKLFTKKQTA